MSRQEMAWLDARLVDEAARLEFECERYLQETTTALAVAIEDSGFTQAQIGQRLGKSAAFVSQVLSGRRNCTLKTIAEVAWAAGARLDTRWSVMQPTISVDDGTMQSSVISIRKFVFQPREQAGTLLPAPAQHASETLGDGVAA